MEFNSQLFGGRGGSSHSGGGGGGGGSTKKTDENRKGSASNPVKASELTAMNEKERISALNAMPVGTRVRKYNNYYDNDEGSTYVKFEDGWKMEQTYQAVSRGRLVNRVHYPQSFTPAQISAQSISNKGSTDVWRTTQFITFSSVRYPKK
jgi:hypothetical protein|nr:MAG TPA: Intron-binding protein aquarius N-terminus [Caudoviricetes sp.]